MEAGIKPQCKCSFWGNKSSWTVLVHYDTNSFSLGRISSGYVPIASIKLSSEHIQYFIPAFLYTQTEVWILWAALFVQHLKVLHRSKEKFRNTSPFSNVIAESLKESLKSWGHVYYLWSSTFSVNKKHIKLKNIFLRWHFSIHKILSMMLRKQWSLFTSCSGASVYK